MTHNRLTTLVLISALLPIICNCATDMEATTTESSIIEFEPVMPPTETVMGE